jgi:hypothetical protein
VIIWQANEGDHAGPLHNIVSAKQLRHFSQVRDHLVRDSALSAASKTVNFELGVLRKSHDIPTSAGMPGGNVAR